MGDELLLSPTEVVEGRPFTDPDHTTRETAALRRLLERERARARAWANEAGNGREVVVLEEDHEGHRHLFVVPDPAALLHTENPTVVGFFGSPRDDVDHSVLFELEDQLVASMPSYGQAGLLSYYDVELVKGSYGNLILFSTPDVPRAWHDNPIHLRAIDVSPGHYHGIRLHKGRLAGRLLDGGELTIDRTRYLMFENGRAWRATRSFATRA